MNALYYIDKSNWGEGDWLVEPDYANWLDAPTSYACVIRRSEVGALCGYIGIDPEHPLYNVRDKTQYEFITVHQGPVASIGWCAEDDIMFTPAIRRFWIGFSCVGKADLCPGMIGDPTIRGSDRPRKRLKNSSEYRTFSYVQAEVEGLAEQLAFLDSRL